MQEDLGDEAFYPDEEYGTGRVVNWDLFEYIGIPKSSPRAAFFVGYQPFPDGKPIRSIFNDDLITGVNAFIDRHFELVPAADHEAARAKRKAERLRRSMELTLFILRPPVSN